MTLNNGDVWSSDPQYSSVRERADINSYDRIKRGEELNLIGRAVGGVFSGVGGGQQQRQLAKLLKVRQILGFPTLGIYLDNSKATKSKRIMIASLQRGKRITIQE